MKYWSIYPTFWPKNRGPARFSGPVSGPEAYDHLGSGQTPVSIASLDVLAVFAFYRIPGGTEKLEF